MSFIAKGEVMQNKLNKTLKAYIICVLGCGILATSAFGAEKDGAYMGVELGANRVKFKQDLTMSMGQGISPMIEGDIKANNILPSVAIKGGYKMFFGAERKVGVRAYGAVGVGYGRLINVKYNLDGQMAPALSQRPGVTDSIFTGTKDTYYTTFIDYYVGADLLYNFAPKNDTIWGIYAGVGVGGVTWVANGKDYEVTNGDRSYFNFSASANLGLRATIKQKHGIELGARVYFPKSEIFDASGGKSVLMTRLQVPETATADTTTTHYRPFSVVLSYIYNF